MKDILPLHLPSGWPQVFLGSITDRISNGVTKRQTKNGQGFAVSRIETISQGVIDFSRVGYLTDLSPSEVENYRLHAGDILFSHINSDLHLGKTAVVPTNGDPLLHGMNLLLIRVNQKKVLPLFLHWLFNYYRVTGFFMSIAQHAVNQSSINQAKLKTLPIVLPPLGEQRKIVAEIEKQFTRLDAGVAGLRRVQANLKGYRAAVLKAACEGKLVPTEAELARQEGRTYETGAQLLDRILSERRQKWNGKGKYKEPGKPAIETVPTLPEGWTLTGFEQLSDGSQHAIKAGPFGSSLKKTVYAASGFKIYGQEQVINGDPYFGDYFIAADLYEQLRSCAVKPGDILISLVGTTGKVLILPENCAPGIINPRLLKLSLNRRGVSARYIKILLESPQTRAFFKLFAHGGTMEILNLGILKSLPIALPPFAEQQRIVSEVERRLSVVEEIETVVNANLQRVTRLRQSILQRAFEGRLLS